MDAKVFRMALLTIISAFILVLVIIYATNADKIGKLLGKNNNSSSAEASFEVPKEAAAEGVQQIGDDLKSFMYDDSFFDETEQIPAVVVIKKNYSSSSAASSEASDFIEDEDGTGMAVVGQLENPDSLDSAIIEGSVDTSMGTPVGMVPARP